jgi:hypothetical protein
MGPPKSKRVSAAFSYTVSPLRQRMIEDMNARELCAEAQAAFLKESPDAATAEKKAPSLPPTPSAASATSPRKSSTK